MATLLFLGASVSQLPAIRFARDAGHRVIAVDGDPAAVAFALCHVAEVVDFTDVDRVAAVAENERAEGVLAICTDRAVVPAAMVAERVGLPGIGAAVARAMTHKPTMRSRLAHAGVPQPRHLRLTAETDLEEAAGIPLPAVLKPADSGGQRGLFLIGTRDELVERLPETLAASRSGEAMFEQYVEGVELNGLLAVRGGVPTPLTLSDRLRPTGAGFGVGWIHSFPSSLPDDVLGEVSHVASEAVRALGLRDGIAFPQLIASADGVVVVEVAARIAAGQMADLVRHGTGIELFEIAIGQALGAQVADSMITPRFVRPIAIRFLTAAPGPLPLGTVTAIENLDRVRSAPGVIDAGVYFDVGTHIGPLQVDADRRGYIITTAETPSRALELADAAAGQLVIRTGGPRRLPRLRSAANRRALPITVAGVLLLATAAAFVLADGAKLQPSLLAGTRVDKQFSPVCRCPQDIAHIAFRLLRRTRVLVQVVNASGRPVRTLLPDRVLHGPVQLVWNGRGPTGQVLPNGPYFPELTFAALHRALRLPSRIELDADLPKIEQVTVLVRRATVVLRYRFDEPAQAALLVDGRRTILTRFARTTGSLRWSGSIPEGRRAPPGRHRLSLLAIDPAGNHSRPRRVLVRLRSG